MVISPLPLSFSLSFHSSDSFKSSSHSSHSNSHSSSKVQENELNFYNLDFSNKLHQRISSKNDIGFDDLFWYDLLRLLFKWSIYIKQFANTEEFEEAMTSVRLLTSMIDRQAAIFFFVDFSNLEFSKDFSGELKQLMDYEIMERIDDIFPIFHSALERFYTGQIDCIQLKNEYFGGNFEGDLVLKSMFYTYDPVGKIKRCFQEREMEMERENDIVSSRENRKSNSSSLSLSISFLTSSSSSDSDSISKMDFLRIKPDKIRKPKLSCMEFTSKKIIDTILESNQKFTVECSIDLIVLLKKLKESNSLTRKPLNEMIDLYLSNKTFGWSKEEFIEYLDLQRDNISKSDYKEYLKLIK